MSKWTKTIEQMDPSLAKEILRALDFRYGKAKAIGGAALVENMKSMAFPVHERAMRETIKQLRRQGWLICSAAGEDGGYYMAQTQQEFEEFATMEYKGKIADMAETLNAMTKAARTQFGDGVQMGLF